MSSAKAPATRGSLQPMSLVGPDKPKPGIEGITRSKASVGSQPWARGSAAGTFTPTKDLYDDAATAHELNVALLERTKTAGAVRPDLDVNDLSFIFEQVASIRLSDPDRTHQLRHRYLALLLDALHTPTPQPLPGPPPTWQDISGRWDHPTNR